MTNDTTPAPVGADALRREELVAMAREADPFGDDGRLVSLAMLTPGTLERFAALVAAAEREACTKACEYRTEQSSDHPVLAALAEGAKGCAAAIRSRGEP
jgi:hypothetical protein